MSDTVAVETPRVTNAQITAQLNQLLRKWRGLVVQHLENMLDTNASATVRSHQHGCFASLSLAISSFSAISLDAQEVPGDAWEDLVDAVRSLEETRALCIAYALELRKDTKGLVGASVRGHTETLELVLQDLHEAFPELGNANDGSAE